MSWVFGGNNLLKNGFHGFFLVLISITKGTRVLLFLVFVSRIVEIELELTYISIEALIVSSCSFQKFNLW